MRVDRPERETHYHFVLRLRIDLREKRVRFEVRVTADPVETDEFGFPTGRDHEIDKGLEVALSRAACAG